VLPPCGGESITAVSLQLRQQRLALDSDHAHRPDALGLAGWPGAARPKSPSPPDASPSYQDDTIRLIGASTRTPRDAAGLP